MAKASAADRYAKLTGDRTIFLDTARECARLTLPHLLTPTSVANGQKLPTPWQSVGAKGVNVMASKLMLSLFPITASFFKLQVNDGKLASDPALDEKIRSELDESLSKIERVVLQHIAESMDRVFLHQAMKHLLVTGNVLIFISSEGIRLYPLDRFCVVRDGNQRPTEVVTVEAVNRQFLPKSFQVPARQVNHTGADSSSPSTDVTVGEEEVAVYTHAKLVNEQWVWRQEAEGQIIPGTYGKAPKGKTPWLPLRFNVVDGEDYGRGRIEEYLGDLKSLEGLMQAMVEGSAAAAKVVFLVSPSATVKPATLAKAGNGAMIQGRSEDVTVVQVDKRADFQTVQTMIEMLTRRLSEAFLVLNVRDSERTTAEEIRMTQQELNEQLGGIFGNLSSELLRPYIEWKLHSLQRKGLLPKLPPGLVMKVVAGLEGVGRGQDREALMMFMTTLQQSLPPEVVQQYINPEEAIKRLAASMGIETLNLVKNAQTRQADAQQGQAQAAMQSLVGQAGQLVKAPVLDPTKNPEALDAIRNVADQFQPQAAASPQPGGGVPG